VVGEKDADDSKCMVYTRTGDYIGYEQDESGWELIFQKRLNMKQSEIANLGPLDREVTIPAGSKQAFYVFCAAGIMHTMGDTEGSAFDSDGSIVISEGVSTGKSFQKLTRNARYSGGIRYYESPLSDKDALLRIIEGSKTGMGRFFGGR